MKTKLFTVLLITAFFSAPALFGQVQHSFLTGNTMTIFKTDADKLQDVNDYAEVDINKAYIMAGSHYDTNTNAFRGIRGGVATNLNSLYLGILYDGYFWDGDADKVTVNGNRQAGADTGFNFDNRFNVLFGKKSFGGIAVSLGFSNLNFDKDANDIADTTTTTRRGIINFGAMWGKNFARSKGTLKPELGFMTLINMNENKTKTGNTTTVDGHGPSSLMLYLTSEYVFSREGQHQTTLNFGDIPWIYFPYENKGPPKTKFESEFYNTLFFELKQVYDITGSLSVGYLAGLNLAINKPGGLVKDTHRDVFELGFLPRLSLALTYKASEKFLFNTGVRLGSLYPDEIVTEGTLGQGMPPFTNLNTADSFGLFYRNDNNAGTKTSTWDFLPFRGAWGIGMLWQPDRIFSADFSVNSDFNSTPGAFNFNVLFALNL